MFLLMHIFWCIIALDNNNWNATSCQLSVAFPLTLLWPKTQKPIIISNQRVHRKNESTNSIIIIKHNRTKCRQPKIHYKKHNNRKWNNNNKTAIKQKLTNKSRVMKEKNLREKQHVLDVYSIRSIIRTFLVKTGPKPQNTMAKIKRRAKKIVRNRSKLRRT